MQPTTDFLNQSLPMASEKVLDRWSREDRAAIKDPKARRALAKGAKLVQRQEWQKALPYLLQAWDKMPNNVDLLATLAFALIKLGVRDKAIAVMERALQHGKPTLDFLKILGVLAASMAYHDIAEKVNRILIGMEPGDVAHHVNLMTAMYNQDKLDETINYAQSVIPLFPAAGELWSALATAVYYRDGAKASYVFYEEALRHAPDDFKIHSNYAGAQEDPDVAIQHFETAIKLNPDNAEPHMGLSFYKFRSGDIQAGCQHYRWRFHEGRSVEQRVIWSHSFPEWQGEDLSGKTIFVTNEQGLGDELFFLMLLRYLVPLAGQVIVACDHRLVGPIERSYPSVRVTTGRDRMVQGYKIRSYPMIEQEARQGTLKVDYAVHMGELMHHFWPDPSHIEPQSGYVEPDQALLDKWAGRLAALGRRPKVGVAWTSMKLSSGRSHTYLSLDNLLPILQLEGIDFINVQYGDRSAELAALRERHGIDLHGWDDFDIKDDLEDNFALMAQCDAVIGPANAGLHMAALGKGGRPWWILVDRPWWSFGSEDGIPWMQDYKLYDNAFAESWDATIAKVTDDMAALRDAWQKPRWE